MKQTSIDAYNVIMASGHVSKRHKELWDVLRRHENMTVNECFAVLKNEKYPDINLDSNSHARLTEMRESGIAKEVGERTCQISGRNATAWEAVEGIPVPRPKKKTVKQIIAELESRILELEAQLIKSGVA